MQVVISHSARDWELAMSITPLLLVDGHHVVDVTQTTAPGNALAAVSAFIRSADLFVALVTAGGSNIFYEIGLAVGAGVPTLIAAAARELLPADLAAVPYVQLTGDILTDAQVVARRTSELKVVSSSKATQCQSAEAALQAAARDAALLESLQPTEFERLLMQLFKERGYAVTPAAPDMGADIVISTGKGRILIEVKKLNKQSRVSVETVRQLSAAVSAVGASIGMLVATSGYTAAAIAFAASTPIILRSLEQILAARSEQELLESNIMPMNSAEHV